MFSFITTQTAIMAIINLTPDSFYDGNVNVSPERAVAAALQAQADGAHIIDLGAQSTRPGSIPVPPAEELRRLLLVLAELRGKLRVPISVDTFSPEIAEQALQHGAAIINDVSGHVTAEMAQVIAHHGAGWVLMHNGGGADAMPVYTPDVVTCVRDELAAMISQAEQFGITRAQLCIDPGIGFGKTQPDNLRLLSHIAKLKVDDVAMLVGASRKRVTGEHLPPSERLPGTIAAHTIAQLGGANILRVHDVREALQAAQLLDNVAKIM
ncbi:MAG: dihydropteroate synthase [Oscillospiraceae bacterium]|nr:dihydropteroate synthase [Oscillospiraceae bacterium]